MRRRIVAEYEKTIAQMIGELQYLQLFYCIGHMSLHYLFFSFPAHVNFILNRLLLFRGHYVLLHLFIGKLRKRCSSFYVWAYCTQATFAVRLQSCLVETNDSVLSSFSGLIDFHRRLTLLYPCSSRRSDYYSCLISFRIRALSHKGTICLCLSLTLGSFTCLALPAWLNTVPSFLFCSHLCPLLFDNPDRHARWVTLLVLHFTSHHPSIMEESTCPLLLHLMQCCLFVHFVSFWFLYQRRFIHNDSNQQDLLTTSEPHRCTVHILYVTYASGLDVVV